MFLVVHWWASFHCMQMIWYLRFILTYFKLCAIFSKCFSESLVKQDRAWNKSVKNRLETKSKNFVRVIKCPGEVVFCCDAFHRKELLHLVYCSGLIFTVAGLSIPIFRHLIPCKYLKLWQHPTNTCRVLSSKTYLTCHQTVVPYRKLTLLTVRWHGTL